jgi:hypothetical protein
MPPRLLGVGLLVLLGASLGAPARAQPSSKRATAVRVQGQAPRIDGRLADDAWRSAQPIEDLEQQRPIEGGVPSERTQIYLLYDNDALYVGARMYRSDPSRISRSVTRRDGGGNAERLSVTLDTHLDRRTGYGFAISAAGVRSDFHHSQDDEMRGRENQYDPVWDAAAVIDSLGWTAEMRIPFSQLRFPNTETQEWGLQFDRWMPDKNEDLQWVVIPTRETGYISRFGRLLGLTGIRPVRPVELLPYTAGDTRRSAVADPANPFRNPSAVRLGVDAKFGIGSNLTVDATINPDFGQVEADPAEVNLSAFETIVEERRPFFTEGSQLMRVEGPNYFYSRRVGAPPHRSVSGDYVDQPRASTILGAAKLTGRTASRLSVGALLAVTDVERARVFHLDSAWTGRPVVEPRNAFAVVRLQQEVGRQASTVGAAFTAIRRDVASDSALASLLTSEALAGGLDWRARFREGEYAISGWAGFSYVAGDSLAVGRIQRSSAHYFSRPDAKHLTYDPALRRLSGYTASIRADKDAGRHVLWGAQVMAESPGYEVNDLGRLQSADDIEYNADIQIRETIPGKHLQNWRLGFMTKGAFNYGGDRTNHEWSQSTTLTFRNFWNVNVNTRLDLETLDDALTRGGPLMKTALGWGQEYRLNSPMGSRTSYRLNLSWGRNALGGWRVHRGGNVTFRPAPRWQFSLEPSYQTSVDVQQYVTAITDSTTTSTFGKRYVFASVDRATISMRTRLNYAISGSLTVEGYAEPFAASGRFHDFGELAAPRTNALRLYGTGGTSVARNEDGSWSFTDGTTEFTLSNRDFNVLSFRSNLVMRWEWNPGSALFLVWQQNRRSSEPVGTAVRFSDLTSTTRAAGDNYFALKISYWFRV